MRIFLRFGLVGLLNTATHIVVAGFLLGLDDGYNHPVRANFVAFLVATTVGYIFNTLWSFSTRMSYVVLMRYVTVAGVGAALSAILSAIGQQRGTNPWLAVVATVAVIPIISFILHQKWTYFSSHCSHHPSRFFGLLIPALAVSVLGALVLVLHGSAFNGYWRWDDGLHLLRATQYSISDVFTDTTVMRHASGNQIAPFNLAIYIINKAIFGLNPVWFYAQHLLVLWFASVVFWRLLCFWVHPLAALLGAVLVILGLPSSQIAQQLMTGHYVLGWLAVCGMLWAWMQARLWFVTRHRLAWVYAVFASLLYIVACLSKEVYVPAILLLPFIPFKEESKESKELNVSTQLSRWYPWVLAIPVVLVALAYTGLRWYAFQGVGGYHNGEFGNQVWVSSLGIFTTLLGVGWSGIVASLCLLIALVGVVGYTPRSRILLSLGLLVAVGVPLLFLSIATPDWGQHARYLFAPWLLVGVLWANWLSPCMVDWVDVRTHYRTVLAKAMVFCIFLGAVFFPIQERWEQDRQIHTMFDVLGRYVTGEQAGLPLIPPTINAPGYVVATLSAVNAVYRSESGAGGDGGVSHLQKMNMVYPQHIEDISANTIAWYPPCSCLVKWSVLPLSQQLDYFKQRQTGFVLERLGNPSAQAIADGVDGWMQLIHRDAQHVELEGWIPSSTVGAIALWLKPPSQITSNPQFEWRSGRENSRETNFHFSYSTKSMSNKEDAPILPCLIVQSQKTGEEHLFKLIQWADPVDHARCSQLLTPVGRHG